MEPKLNSTDRVLFRRWNDVS